MPAVGKAEKNTLFVENLLLTGEFADEKIASLAAVPLEFVKKVKERLILEGKIKPPIAKKRNVRTKATRR